MNYNEALEYVHSKLVFGSKPGLERIGYLLNKLDNPQDKLKFVHVAGTNGKGSTCSMLAEVFKSQGYKTGLYISPFVIDFRERISIDGEYIPESDFADIIEKVMPLCEGMEDPITEFELITACAFLYFHLKECDIVVLETGLGGRFDATNIIKSPLASVITKIDYDHMQYLGDTLSKIAGEKAGIIKQGGICVSYPCQDIEAFDAIKQAAQEKNAGLYVADLNEIQIISESIYGSNIIYRDVNMFLSLCGRHQIYNLATVLKTIEAVNENTDIKVGIDALKSGIERVSFPARVQIIQEEPLTILDAAHNPNGVDALCDVIDGFLNDKKIYTVMGILADKDYKQCIRKIANRSSVFYAVEPINPRKLSAKECADEAAKYCKEVYYYDDIYDAVRSAAENMDKDDVLLFCGSLYLASEIVKIYNIDK